MIRNVESRNILQGLFDKWNGESEPSKEYLIVEPRSPNYFSLRNNSNGCKRIEKSINGVQSYICNISPNYLDRAEEVRYYLQEHYDPNYTAQDYVNLIKQNKDFDFIRFIDSKRSRNPKPKKIKTPKAPMRWDEKGELLFHNVKTNLTPYNLDVICSLHANYDNPFTFGDYVLQNLPRALPSAVFYLCENYDMIPKLSSEGKKILDKR